jgi:molybdopterin molybdotransferase
MQVEMEEAAEMLLVHTREIFEPESIPLFGAFNRCAFMDIHASMPQPPFDRVLVDGYAVRHEDIASASPRNPVRLRVTQHLFAGSGSPEPLGAGQAARVMTGAMLPPGADCAIWQEDTDGGEESVVICRSIKKHQNCRLQAQDIVLNQLLARRGDVLHSTKLSLLAGQGHTHVRVFRQPKVAVLATGDELFPAGFPLPQGKIYDISNIMLGARLSAMGMNAAHISICGDNMDELRSKMGILLNENDMLITTGGTSSGKKDFIPAVVSELAAENGGIVLFKGIRIKPGSLTLGMVMRGKILLGLSGNPASALATFEMLAAPVLKKMSGRSRYYLERQKGIAQNNFGKYKKDVRHFVMAQMVGKNVFIRQYNGSTGAQGVFDEYNCFVDIPAGCRQIQKGMEVDVILV